MGWNLWNFKRWPQIIGYMIFVNGAHVFLESSDVGFFIACSSLNIIALILCVGVLINVLATLVDQGTTALIDACFDTRTGNTLLAINDLHA